MSRSDRLFTVFKRLLENLTRKIPEKTPTQQKVCDFTGILYQHFNSVTVLNNLNIKLLEIIIFFKIFFKQMQPERFNINQVYSR